MIACRTPRLSRALAFGPVFLLLAASVRAEDRSSVTLRGESRAAESRLADARKKLDAHKWSEAVRELQSILNTLGDDLVPVVADSQRSGRPALSDSTRLVARRRAEAVSPPLRNPG